MKGSQLVKLLGYRIVLHFPGDCVWLWWWVISCTPSFFESKAAKDKSSQQQQQQQQQQAPRVTPSICHPPSATVVNSPFLPDTSRPGIPPNLDPPGLPQALKATAPWPVSGDAAPVPPVPPQKTKKGRTQTKPKHLPGDSSRDLFIF